MDAQFLNGYPVKSGYTPASAVAGGEVVVIGNLPCVAHIPIPQFTGGPGLGSLSTFGGVYSMTADGAIACGTDVYWDDAAKKVTLTAASNTHFGKLLAGPDGDMVGAGTATDGDVCIVAHCPALIEAGASLSAPLTITSNGADALAVGPNGTTNPTFQVDGSTSSAATGIKVKSAAAAAGVAVSVVSSGTDESLTVDAKGAGLIKIGNTSTGLVAVGRGSAKQPIISGATYAVTAQNITPTAAQCLGGVIGHTSGTGAGTFTFPSGTNLSTGVSGVTAGDTFECLYANLGNQTVTLTGATGSTLVGTAAVPSGKNALLIFVNTGSNTWNVYSVLSA